MPIRDKPPNEHVRSRVAFRFVPGYGG